jgi:hypothetical protein
VKQVLVSHSFNERNYFLPISRLFEVFGCQVFGVILLMKEIILCPFPDCLKCSGAKFACIFEYQSKTGGVVGIPVIPLYHFTKISKLSKTRFL